MQNKITKPEKTISPSNLPSIITAVVLIVGIGVVYGLIGYLFSGIKENITPVIQVSENRSDLDKIEKPVVFEEEGDISDWKVYRNEEYGYEIKYSKDWKNKGSTDDYFFQTFFESKNAEFLVRTNQLGSVSPFTFPSSPTCRNEGEFVVLSDNNLPKIIFSSFQEGISEKKCNDFLLDEHLILGGFCVDKNLKVYPAEVIKGRGEYLFYCGEETDLTTLLDFQLFCKGEEWQKKEGLEKCNELFDQILSTFKFIEKDETANWQTYRNEESGLEVKYPSEYPDGSNVVIEDFSNYFIKILNFEYLEEMGMFPDRNDETEDDFIVELLKRTGADAASYTFQIKKDFDEYQGIKIFGGNEFYSGYNYGPIDAKTYIYKNDTNVRISFYKNYTDNLISGILSTFKFIEKDETADENKPSIYPSKGRGSLLLLNGEKTGFYAYEFEKENIILFQEEIYDKEKSQNHYSLKTISTVSPYEIKTLIDNKYTNCMNNGRFLGEKNNVYFFKTETDAPGFYYELFLFNPVNMDFVLIINLYRYYDGPHSISLYSSVSKTPFNFEKRSRISLRTEEILLPNDNDIEIIFNEKSFTKKEVDQGKADYIKDIFNYNFKPFAFIETDEINNRESNDSVDAYLKYFPEKIPYFASDWYKYGEDTEDFWANPDGYFDFEKNEFISSL